VHGQCVTADAGAGVWSCRHCNEREPVPGGEPILIAPGLVDPLPDAVLDPCPPAWHTHALVKARHVRALGLVSSAPLAPPGHAAGDGIVYVGGGRYWPMLCVAVRMTRRFSALPIRLYHRGQSEPVRPDDLGDVVALEVIDLEQLGPRRRRGGWEAKAVALLDAPWERVLYLDADAYCVSDPAPFLDLATPAFPLVYWQDLPNHDGQVDWSMASVPTDPRIPAVQGGQLAIHRAAGWRLLAVQNWICQHSDYWFRAGYGDQDMWRIAMHATRTAGRALGRAELVGGSFVCRLDGQAVVVHRTSAKWWGGADDVQLAGLPLEAEAWALRSAPPPATAPQAVEYLKDVNASPRAPCGPSAGQVFGRVYQTGQWGPVGTSGAGSGAREAAPYLTLVSALSRIGGWGTAVDLGCGDGAIALALDVPAVHGVDCVRELIDGLSAARPERQWSCLDIDRDRDRLPVGAVALVKDVLHHWPNDLVVDWLRWAHSARKWRCLLLTFDHPNASPERDCPLGGYRPLSPALPWLADLGLVPVCTYLHKTVCWLPL
jgi:hypothetical protein